MASGWERLGAALGGMGQAREDAYRKRLGDNIALGIQGNRLHRGNMELDSLHSGLGDSLIASGMSPEQAAVVVANARANSGSDFAAAMRGLGSMQEQGFRQAAVDAPTFTDANRYLMGVANGPAPLATVQGDTLIGNRLAEGGGEVRPTDIGQSIIGANAARAGASHAQAQAALIRANAAAGREAARAGLYRTQAAGGFSPSSRGSAGTAVAKPPAQAEIDRAFGKGDDFDMERYRDFLLFQKNTGGSLGDYLMQGASNPKINFIDPSLPGSMTIPGPPSLDSRGAQVVAAIDQQLAAEGAPPLTREQRARIAADANAGMDFTIELPSSTRDTRFSGVTGGGSGHQPRPSVGMVVDGYRYKGGDPAKQSSWERAH